MQPNRNHLRQAKATERKALKTGQWPEWRFESFPMGRIGSSGWAYEITRAASNGAIAVLIRLIDGDMDGRLHLAIRTASSAELPWRDMQRIKDEVIGEDRIAVQVYPAKARIIDQADMYHLFVLKAGDQLGFGLHPLDEEGH